MKAVRPTDYRVLRRYCRLNADGHFALEIAKHLSNHEFLLLDVLKDLTRLADGYVTGWPYRSWQAVNANDDRSLTTPALTTQCMLIR